MHNMNHIISQYWTPIEIKVRDAVIECQKLKMNQLAFKLTLLARDSRNYTLSVITFIQ